jgi:hypothetical protein
MDKTAPSMLKATLIGGGAAGFAAALPVVGALNCLCCSLVIGGGFLAAYLYSRDCGQAGVEFRPGSGALVGLVAGLFYSIVVTVVGVVVRAIMPAPDIDKILESLEQLDLDPEVIDTIVEFMEMSQSAWGLLIMFFATLLIAAVFSTIGGLIGGAVFKVEAPPSAPSPMGQTPPPPPTTPL